MYDKSYVGFFVLGGSDAKNKKSSTQFFFLLFYSLLGYNVLYTKLPMGLYPASKHALRAIVANVTHEIEAAGDNIRTTVSALNRIENKNKFPFFQFFFYNRHGRIVVANI